MYDIKRIRRDFDEILSAVEKRGKGDFGLLEIRDLEKKRRDILVLVEQLRNEQKTKSRLIPQFKKEGKDAMALLEELKSLSSEISLLDEQLKEVECSFEELLYYVPNTPHDDIPLGKGEDDNVELRRWAEPRVFDFEAKPHWDLGVERDFLDFERGAKVVGSRFTFVKGACARLERALMNYFLDFHTLSGKYTEIGSPGVANRQAMTGTGQLPKFIEDMYHCTEDDYFLIPTAEVTLTNFHREEILPKEDLPVYITAFTQCYRREAGSAGRDTKGIIRQHQFGKVELVKLVEPKSSFEELEDMVSDVERLIQSLELPYRVIELCSGDVGFSSAKTYDLEVWFPSYDNYREISSCSNFLDFQARRCMLRYRNEEGKVEFLHTLNGSGIPTGRCLAAIIENNQTEDGKIRIPKVLRPYMGGLDEI
ncbi:MAG: serine--tRNA ligase [Tissierellia bacterium]|jgi:seryl-tRNA synthetase|nr:serine--tRNA ligase [Tissierellia bacterium]